MLVFPNAKINIGLNIVEKRSDNYHTIESVFYPVPLTDALEVVENIEKTNERVVFSSSGFLIPGDVQSNLCCKAYELISKDYPLPPIKIHLHKNIPIGAGLGGGSSDAAFFIKLVNELFGLSISWGEMHHYARQLGSDCSFFISNRAVFAEQKGDEYESIALDLSAYHLALVYPPIAINTGNAYASVSPATPSRSLEDDILNLPIEQWKDFISNDFEKSIFLKYPQIKLIKEQLYAAGAVYASLSGSGSAVYGLFKKKTELSATFSKMFLWEGQLK